MQAGMQIPLRDRGPLRSHEAYYKPGEGRPDILSAATGHEWRPWKNCLSMSAAAVRLLSDTGFLAWPGPAKGSIRFCVSPSARAGSAGFSILDGMKVVVVSLLFRSFTVSSS